MAPVSIGIASIPWIDEDHLEICCFGTFIALCVCIPIMVGVVLNVYDHLAGTGNWEFGDWLLWGVTLIMILFAGCLASNSSGRIDRLCYVVVGLGVGVTLIMILFPGYLASEVLAGLTGFAISLLDSALSRCCCGCRGQSVPDLPATNNSGSFALGLVASVFGALGWAMLAILASTAETEPFLITNYTIYQRDEPDTFGGIALVRLASCPNLISTRVHGCWSQPSADAAMACARNVLDMPPVNNTSDEEQKQPPKRRFCVYQDTCKVLMASDYCESRTNTMLLDVVGTNATIVPPKASHSELHLTALSTSGSCYSESPLVVKVPVCKPGYRSETERCIKTNYMNAEGVSLPWKIDFLVDKRECNIHLDDLDFSSSGLKNFSLTVTILGYGLVAVAGALTLIRIIMDIRENRRSEPMLRALEERRRALEERRRELEERVPARVSAMRPLDEGPKHDADDGQTCDVEMRMAMHGSSNSPELGRATI